MQQKKINELIEKRERLTNRRDGLTDSKRIARIDAQLATVPLGENNAVDLLLHRPGAKLPERAEYFMPDPNSPREILARQQRSEVDDETILKNWPLCSAACQIRRERANEKWSTDAERREWKDEAAQQAAQAAQAKEDDFLRHIADQHKDMLDFLRICGDLAL